MGNKERQATTLIQQYILAFPNKGLGVLVPGKRIDMGHDRSGGNTVVTKKTHENRKKKLVQALGGKQDVTVTLEELVRLVFSSGRPSLLVDTAYHNFFALDTQKIILATASKLGLVDSNASTISILKGSWAPDRVNGSGKKHNGRRPTASQRTATQPAFPQPSL